MKNQAPRFQRRWLNTIGLLSLTLGVMLLVNGSYIQLKAELAQVLMSSTWQQSKLTGTPSPPWPWADTQVIGKLNYLNKQQFVLAGESGRNLAFGPSLMSASAPLNEGGNSVIVGHRDTHFYGIQYLKIGDTIILESVHGQVQYEVTEHAIVTHTDVSVLAPTGFAVLTLITCYPFDSVSANPHLRYVVRAIIKSR